MAYLWGIVRSVSGGLWWWLSLFVTYFFQAATFSDYPKFRDAINTQQSVIVMPTELPLWVLVVPFLAWVIARLAHNEAMRYWRAGRVVFDPPVAHPLWHLLFADANGNTVKDLLMSSVTIEVKNAPYKSDSGNDIISAWAKVELFDKESKPLQSWNYPRWEENDHPPYVGTYFNNSQNFRTLSANRSPSRITIAVKQFMEPTASRLRGVDQNQGWKDNANLIPPGEYLVRLTMEGKGLQEPAVSTFKLRNPGSSGALEVYDAGCRIEKHWTT